MRSKKQNAPITYKRTITGVEITGNGEDVKQLIEKDLNRSNRRWYVRAVILLLELLLRC